MHFLGARDIRVGSSEVEQRQSPQAVGSNPTRPAILKEGDAMPIIYCTYCGDSFQGKRDAKFCCIDCYKKQRWQDAAKRRSQQKAKWQLDGPGLDACVFNEGVACFPAGDCKKCGWNPAVAQKRLERILAKLLGVEEVLADGG